MFFDFKSRSTFTNRPSKKEKLCLKKRNYLKKKKNLHDTAILGQSLQKKWHFFVRGLPKLAIKQPSEPKIAILAEKSADSFARIAEIARIAGITRSAGIARSA